MKIAYLIYPYCELQKKIKVKQFYRLLKKPYSFIFNRLFVLDFFLVSIKNNIGYYICYDKVEGMKKL